MKNRPLGWTSFFISSVLFITVWLQVGLLLPSVSALEATPIKKRVAVMRFESTDKFGGGDVGEGLSAMLSNELSKTGQFVVVERAALSDILGEQQLGAKGAATSESAARGGNLLGAQILIRGTVTDFEEAARGGGSQFSIAGGNLPIGAVLGGGGNTAHVAVDLRLIDAATGEVLDTYRAVGQAKASSKHFGIQHVGTGIGFGTEQFNKTPLGKAALEAIEESVQYIVKRAKSLPWTGRVSEVSEGKVYVNAGKDVGLEPGNTLETFVVVKEIRDPESGAILGVEEHRLGSVKVEAVFPKYAIASILEGPPPKAGDIVRSQVGP